MSVHPLTAPLAAANLGTTLATCEMAESPEGVHVILLSPRNTPDCIECRLRLTDGNVQISPEGGTTSIAGIGDESVARHKGVYGLGPCPCCAGDLWRLIVPFVYVEGWPELLGEVGRVLATHILARPELYCHQDLRAMIVHARRRH